MGTVPENPFVEEGHEIVTGERIKMGNSVITSGHGYLCCREPAVGRRAEFFERIIGGDSGSPRFLLKGDELLLLNSAWTASYGNGCLLSEYTNAVIRKAQELDPAYSITIDDWSAYPKRVHGELR